MPKNVSRKHASIRPNTTQIRHGYDPKRLKYGSRGESMAEGRAWGCGGKPAPRPRRGRRVPANALWRGGNPLEAVAPRRCKRRDGTVLKPWRAGAAFAHVRCKICDAPWGNRVCAAQILRPSSRVTFLWKSERTSCLGVFGLKIGSNFVPEGTPIGDRRRGGDMLPRQPV